MIPNLLRMSALLLAISPMAQAAPLVYFAENLTPAGMVAGAPLTQRDLFAGALPSGVSKESFEGIAVPDPIGGTPPPIALTFAGSGGPITATLDGSGRVFDTAGPGTFATSPNKFWETTGTFEITFDMAISAFGFYGTDIGDFAGQITIALTDTANNVTNLTVNSTVNANDGSLLFWGFIDATTEYNKIRFSSTLGDNADTFGFDDMIIADRRQVIAGPTPPPQGMPEPGSLLLAGLALTGLAAARRRR